MTRQGYYITAARRAGVPRIWLEDAAQDIAIKVWRAGDPPYWRTVARRGAVDAARRYGPVRRTGTARAEDWAAMPPTAPLRAQYDPGPAWDAILDLSAAWPRLTAIQRAGLCRAVTRTNHDAGGWAAWSGRQALRRLTAVA